MAATNNILTTVLLLKLFAQLLHESHIAEGLDTSNDLSLSILEQGTGDGDGLPSALRVHDMHGFVDAGLAGFHGLTQRTAGLAKVGFQDVLTALAKGLLSWDARYLLGGVVKRCDAPVLVDREDAVGNAIQNDVSSIV